MSFPVHFLDLQITKAPDFEESGRVVFATSRKPTFNPQYLAFFSEHPLSTKKAVFKGECVRHLINCSTESAYEERISELREALSRRRYPPALLGVVPFDNQRRERLLLKLWTRSLERTKGSENVICFRLPFNTRMRSLRLRWWLMELVSRLRRVHGQNFLANTRVVIAHPVKKNLFLSIYRYNFLLGSRSIGRGRAGSVCDM